MSTMLVQDERDDATVSRDVLASLSQSLYRSLPWPAHTIDACLKIVAEAERTNNPRRVRAWIDVERSVPKGNDLLGCLDGVLQQLTRPGVGFSDRLRFANKVRQDAVDYLRITNAASDAAGTLDPNATILADGLMAALALHDPQLAAHAEATADLARRLAVHAGLDAATIARATLAARLHDIGKMRISRSILTKPMPLTAAERDEVRSYPTVGASVLAGLPALAEIAPLVAAHRECADGSGYPERRTLLDIPIESRIVAIVDTFHTMTLPRAYRKTYDANEALAELLATSGKQFDGELVNAFATMIGFRARVARSA
jgi:HD-GYP domain-containing protein (c-di-GMP phosphodiesterase class II)